MVYRKFAVLIACCLAFAPAAHADGVDSDNLKEFGKGIIKDYSNMAENDPIEWVWIAPNTRLANYRYKAVPVENLTSMADSDMEHALDANLDRTLQRFGSKDKSAPLLTVTSAVYWANRASSAKRWIPYAGGHLAQAGLGIELVFTNAQGDIVAKIRHSGREGDELENAAEELVDDIRQFIETT